MSHLPSLISPPPSAPRPVRPPLLPLLSSSSSIWNPTASLPSQSQLWPDTRDAWSSVASKQPCKQGSLPGCSDIKRDTLQGDTLHEDPLPEKPNDDSRRRPVGAIGEGRRDRAKAQYLDNGFHIIDSLQLIPDIPRRSRLSDLSLNLSALNISGKAPHPSPSDEMHSTPSLSSPSESPSTPPDSQSPFARVLNSKSSQEYSYDPRRFYAPLSPSYQRSSILSPQEYDPAELDPHAYQRRQRSPRASAGSGHFNSSEILDHGPQASRTDFNFSPWAGLSRPSYAPEDTLAHDSGSLQNGWMPGNGFSPQFAPAAGSQSQSSLPSSSSSPGLDLLQANQDVLSASLRHSHHLIQRSDYLGPTPVPAPYTSQLVHTSSLPMSPEAYDNLMMSHYSMHPAPLSHSAAAGFGTYHQVVANHQDQVPTSSPVTHFAQAVTETRAPVANEPINFLQLLQPSASPPYEHFVARIISSSDQQASVFLQQKLKVATTESRVKLVEAIVGRGYEMMTHRFGNWAVQRCLEPPCTREDRMRLAAVMRGRIVELSMNCYGTHVIQKALDCEEDIKLLILTELLLGDPYSTLMNKHAAHVWSRIMELAWADPVPPIFPCVNVALKGRWIDLACHETGSLVVQHAFENLEEKDTRDLVNEVLHGFDRVVRDSWGSWVVQHLLEHGAEQDKSRALSLLLLSLHQYGTDPQAIKSVEKALKCGGPDVLDKVVNRLCEPGFSKRRAMLVDLSLNGTGSQLVALILPMCKKDQGTLLYDAIKKHVVTLKGSKAGSRITWLFDKMRAYYGY